MLCSLGGEAVAVDEVPGVRGASLLGVGVVATRPGSCTKLTSARKDGVVAVCERCEELVAAGRPYARPP